MSLQVLQPIGQMQENVLDVVGRLKYANLLFEQKKYNDLSVLIKQNPGYRKLLITVVKELAHNNDFHGCAHILENFIDKIPNDQLLKLIDILRNTLFVWKRKFDMSSFQRCCFLLHRHFQMTEKFIRIMAKLYQSNQKRAQRRLYFWWIPICYDLNRDCGKRMMNVIMNRIENMYNAEYPF